MAAPRQRAFAEMPPLGFGYWQDQFGRTVTARTDVGGEPVAQFNIVEGNGFHLHPGCHPPQDRFRILPNDGAVRRGEWMCDIIVAELQEADANYSRHRDAFMQEHFGEALNATTPIPPVIWKKLGPPPHPWQIMDAMRVGVRYVTHGEGQMPPRLKPFFEQLERTRKSAPTPESIAKAQYEEGLDEEELPVDPVLVDSLEDEAADVRRKAKDAERKRNERKKAAQPQEA